MIDTVQQRIQSLEQHLSSQPRSPLFAQLAAYYLDAGRTRDALDLCDKGLSHYPFFSTGHLIKGKVLLALNMTAEARREFELVQSSFQGLNSLKQILSNLPSAETETLVSPAEARPTQTAAPVADTAVEQPQAEPASAESSPEQILSQFTEAAAETAEISKPAEKSGAESAAVEPSETFPPASELSQEAGVEVPVQTADVFGLETQPETPAEGLAGESFSDFAERKRREFFGLENSQSLDEYLSAGQASETTEKPEPQAEVDPYAIAAAENIGSQAEADPYATTAPESVEPQADTDPYAATEPQGNEPQLETDPYATTLPESNEPQASEDPFALLAQQPAEGSLEAPADQVSDDPFAALTQQSAEEIVETPAEPVSEDPFAQLQQSFAGLASEATPPADEPGQERDQIADLADKLQNAKKITPIIDLSERSTTPPSESETPSSTGFVTPTLAEIYAKQGWYDDAIKAYRTLALSKPAEKEKFEVRIRELEELKKQQESG